MSNSPIVILMGGQSKRMGSDKAFKTYQGQTFLTHQIQKLSAFSNQIYLSVNEKQYAKLHESHQCILDVYPDKGPLGGIYSCLAKLKCSIIFIPIDMPEAHRLIGKLMQNENSACFICKDELQIFPLQLVYNELNEISFRLIREELQLYKYISNIKLTKIYVNDIKAFVNINYIA